MATLFKNVQLSNFTENADCKFMPGVECTLEVKEVNNVNTLRILNGDCLLGLYFCRLELFLFFFFSSIHAYFGPSVIFEFVYIALYLWYLIAGNQDANSIDINQSVECTQVGCKSCIIVTSSQSLLLIFACDKGTTIMFLEIKSCVC